MKYLIFILVFLTQVAQAANPAVIYGSGGRGKIIPSNGLEFKDGETLSGSEVVGMKSTAGTGILNGGSLSIGAPNTTISVTAGIGYIVDTNTDPNVPTVTKVEFGPFTNVPVTNIGVSPITILYVNAAGALEQETAIPTPDKYMDKIILGLVSHQDFATVNATLNAKVPMSNMSVSVKDFADAVGIMNTSGNIFSAGGANLTLQKNAGTTFQYGANFDIDHKIPHTITNTALTPVTNFAYNYRDGLGGYSSAPINSSINPDLYDDGTGVLAVVPNNRFSIQRIYYRPSTDTVDVVYGFEVYASLAGAEAAIFNEVTDINPLVTGGTTLRSWLIVKKNNTNLQTTTEAKFIAAGRFGDTIGSGSTSATTTLQVAYNNSTQPQVILDAIRLGMQIRDASTPIGSPLFEIMSNDGLTAYFSVDATGFSLTNGITVNSILDEDDLVSDSDVALASQQSIKYYADKIASLKSDISILDNPTFWENGTSWTIAETNCPVTYVSGGALFTCTAGTFSVKQNVATGLKENEGLSNQIVFTASVAGASWTTLSNDVRQNTFALGVSTEPQNSELVSNTVNVTSNGIEVYADSAVTGTFFITNMRMKHEDITYKDSGSYFVDRIYSTSSDCQYRRNSTVWGSMVIQAGTCTYISDNGNTSKITNAAGVKILNVRTDGVYRITSQGMMFNQSGIANNCVYSLSDSLNYANNGIAYTQGTDAKGSNTLNGSFKFSSSGDKDIYIINRNNASHSCDFFAGGFGHRSAIFVEFFPDSENTLVSQKAKKTAKTADTFSMDVSITGVVSGDSYDFVNGGCVVSDTSLYTCTYNDIDTTQRMSCGVAKDTINRQVVYHTNSDKDKAIFRITNAAGTATAAGFSVICNKHDDDLNKSHLIQGNFGNQGNVRAETLNLYNIGTYADDTAAGVGGLVTGDVYKTITGELRIKL